MSAGPTDQQLVDQGLSLLGICGCPPRLPRSIGISCFPSSPSEVSSGGTPTQKRTVRIRCPPRDLLCRMDHFFSLVPLGPGASR